MNPSPNMEEAQQQNQTAVAKQLRVNQLWTGMHAANRKKLAFAHNIKDTEGNLVVWEEHIGKPIPPIFTTVPLKYV